MRKNHNIIIHSILLLGITIILTGCGLRMKYSRASQLVDLFDQNSAEFQTAAQILCQYNDGNLHTISTEKHSPRLVEKQIDNLYFYSEKPFTDADYQQLYNAVVPLFSRTDIRSIGVNSTVQLEFLFEIHYGREAKLYYVVEPGDPRSSLTVVEKSFIDENWVAFIGHD